MPKQFLELGRIPLVHRAAFAFLSPREVAEIIVVLPPAYVGKYVFDFDKITVLPGGENRQASVYAGLRAVSPLADVVLVHDGARPFVSRQVIDDVIACAAGGCAAAAGVRATDTIKQTDGAGFVTATPDRDFLWQVQTPQGFPRGILREAHERARREGYLGTDDCALVERYGLARVRMVESERGNIKITTPEDMLYGEAVIKRGRVILHKRD